MNIFLNYELFFLGFLIISNMKDLALGSVFSLQLLFQQLQLISSFSIKLTMKLGQKLSEKDLMHNVYKHFHSFILHQILFYQFNQNIMIYLTRINLKSSDEYIENHQEKNFLDVCHNLSHALFNFHKVVLYRQLHFLYQGTHDLRYEISYHLMRLVPY